MSFENDQQLIRVINCSTPLLGIGSREFRAVGGTSYRVGNEETIPPIETIMRNISRCVLKENEKKRLYEVDMQYAPASPSLLAAPALTTNGGRLSSTIRYDSLGLAPIFVSNRNGALPSPPTRPMSL